MTDVPDMQDVLDALPKGNGTSRLAGKADANELPDGRKVTDLSRAELAEALIDLKIPGASASNTLDANRALYERHLQRIYDEGGEQAVGYWLVVGEHDNDNEDDQKDDDA